MELTHTAILASSRPRDVTLTAGGRALVVVAILLFVASIGAGVGMYGVVRRQAEARRAIAEHGVVTTGTVTRLRSSGDDRRRVGYEFNVNGRVFRGDRSVSDERRRALATGSPIDVRYLPRDPAVNDLGDSRSGLPMPLPFAIAAVLAGLGGLCLFKIHRQRMLLSDGRVAPAVVTGHEKHKTSHGGTHRWIRYEFPLLSGAKASGRSGTSSTPPAIGSALTIVYDPDQPTRSAVYPFSLVKPAR